ncbi:unnamed protein product [Callosobruchus maculatus]|uniref:Phosphatidylinositol N-acetylglucosaminyltransferase subunit H conserved domain-containing protein n=1 Tax=Callosobruchus maculatus TaxID=64391 RepID=A0A653DCB7_CALMS|nr:unnamed protein product [Callosobruchus maculatus]
MVKYRKKEKSTTFESINGNKLQLYLEKKDAVVKIRLSNTGYDAWFRKSILLLGIALLNLFCLLYEIISKKIIVAMFFGALYTFFRLFYIVREESLIIVSDLGMQLETMYLLNKNTKFIPFERVQRIFINEVILREQLPRLNCLEVIYKNIRGRIH